MMQSGGWDKFFGDLTKHGVKTVIDYKIADHSRDNNLSIPEKNMFAASPAVQPQTNVPNHNGAGTPFKAFYTSTGKLNLPVVGGAVLIAVLLLRR